jgi:hypothetical protein
MENINLSTIGDRHTVTVLLTIPAPSSAITGKSPSIGIGDHQYQPSA